MNQLKEKIGFVALGAIVGLTGCGAQSTQKQPITERTSVAEQVMEESNVTYPITLTHALGEITLSEKPENIVAIAWGNPDVALALGIIPTGISEANFGPRDENGLLPWTAEAFEELGVEPNVFSDTDGWDYEAISDAKPDVILAAYSGLSQEEYDRLSEIAPVMAYPQVAWATTWKEEAINDAKAMGMEAEGQVLVDEIDALIESKVSQYPEIEGKNVAFMWLSESDLGSFYIYTNQDPRANFLNDLGLQMPDSIASLITNDEFYITVSAENADMLTDIDVIITYGQESLIQAMKNDGRFSKIPAVQNEAFVLLDSNDKLAAASTPTVLSIPYCLDDYLKAINDALTKED